MAKAWGGPFINLDETMLNENQEEIRTQDEMDQYFKLEFYEAHRHIMKTQMTHPTTLEVLAYILVKNKEPINNLLELIERINNKKEEEMQENFQNEIEREQKEDYQRDLVPF